MDKEKSEEKLEIQRHSLAHILAMAVLKLYPDTKLGIGPAINNGFYYEFLTEHKFTMSDLDIIEKEMHEIINRKLEFKQITVSREEAMDILHQSGQIFKTELLKQVPDEQISFFKTENFLDMCRGPHVKTTKDIGVFKLIKTSNTNWLNQEHRPKLQRIIGVSFNDQETLENYLEEIKNLKFKNHEILGRKLDLLLFDKDFSDKNCIWLPNGYVLKEQVKKVFQKEFQDNNYQIIETPDIAKFIFYKEYFEDEEAKKDYLSPLKIGKEDYLIRSNTLAAHNLVFRSKKVSYRQLPVKYGEFSDCYKNNSEQIQFQTLQGHVYTKNESVIDELKSILSLTIANLTKFGFSNIHLEAITPKEDGSNHYNSIKDAVNYAQTALNELKLLAKISTVKHSKYGVEISFKIIDIFNKTHTISRVILDLYTGVREKINYIDSDNKPQTSAILHHEFICSIEEFVYLLIEKWEGSFPLWMAPIQIKIIPISDKYIDSAQKIYEILVKEDFRVELDKSNNTMQAKIRNAETEKIPYFLIIGDKEIKTNSVSIRQRDGKELGLVRIEEFISKIKAENT